MIDWMGCFIANQGQKPDNNRKQKIHTEFNDNDQDKRKRKQPDNKLFF